MADACLPERFYELAHPLLPGEKGIRPRLDQVSGGRSQTRESQIQPHTSLIATGSEAGATHEICCNLVSCNRLLLLLGVLLGSMSLIRTKKK